ncbi:MAG: outer membrane beta-barrel protein [Proteobacteria bacterium]|nr:outer membrane beta-barrel protein [Pseudomonadota bacterium]
MIFLNVELSRDDMNYFRLPMTKRISFPLKVASIIVLAAFSGAEADQAVISGGGTVRQEYDSNIYRTNRDHVSEWTTAFSPTLIFKDTTQYHSLFFQYTPSVIYSDLTASERWDHWLSGRYDMHVTEHVSCYVRDTFVQAEDPYNDDETGIVLADSRGRKRYWTNNVAVGLDYDYAKQSFIKLSYVNLVLDNEQDAYDDYVKQIPGMSVAHLFGQHWQVQADYSFTRGNFKQEADLEKHSGDLYIYYHPSAETKLFGHGGYAENKYVEVQQNDYEISRASLGFERQVSSTADLRFEGGVEFLLRDVLEDEKSFYYRMQLNKKMQQGSISLSGEGGIDEQQFNGTSEGDLSRYWQIETVISYTLTQYLLSSVSCSFREDRYWELRPADKEEKLQAGASLSYSFGRWFVASVRYDYSSQEADVSWRCYDDNRVFFELGLNKDFYRW